MRFHYLLLFVLPLAFVVSCSNSEKSETNLPENGMEKPKKPTKETLAQFDLAPGRAGQLRVNMPSDSLKLLVPAENLKETEQELEGMRYKAYEIRNAKTGNQLLMLAEESCEKDKCKIFRFRVLSPKFKTKEGIRVGSTFGEVQKAYPISFVGLGEADFVVISEKQRMTFTLDITNFPPKELFKIKAEDIPAETPITSIFLF